MIQALPLMIQALRQMFSIWVKFASICAHSRAHSLLINFKAAATHQLNNTRLSHHPFRDSWNIP